MNLEQGLFSQREFSSRNNLKNYSIYKSISYFGDDDAPFLGGIGGFKHEEENAWKLPDPWKIEEKSKDTAFSVKPQTPTIIKDFPESGFQFHFHENNSSIITGGKIKPWGIEKKEDEFLLDNYKIAMGDLYSDLLGIKRIK